MPGRRGHAYRAGRGSHAGNLTAASSSTFLDRAPRYAATVEESAHLAANRALWDDAVDAHLDSAFYDVEGWLAGASGPRPVERAALGEVAGLELVHLQCHFGQDSLGWARVGARVTGLDFSPAAIAAARALAQRAGLEERTRFVCADVHAAAATLGAGRFDVVYVSLGSLSWLPRVAPWAQQVAALLRPGGRLFLHEVHPLSDALADDTLRVTSTYFEQAEPFVEDAALAYAAEPGDRAARRGYTWSHGLGEVVTALVGNGLVLESLTEHDWTAFARFDWLLELGPQHFALPQDRPRIPLSYSLLARKPPAD